MEGGSNQQDLDDAHFEHLLAERNRREARKRLAMMVSGAAITAAVTFVLLVNFGPRASVLSELPFTKLVPVVTTLMLTSGVTAALLSYLRGSSSSARAVSGTMSLRLLQLENEVENQSRRIETKIKARYVDESTRSTIVAELKQDLTSSVAEIVLDEIQQKVRLSLEQEREGRELRAQLDQTSDRLSDAIAALHLRANVNLVFGILMSVAGISILAYTLAAPVPTETSWDFIRNYVPRVTLVLVVELFAYFFLNLYKANLVETRYYHNEITNIAARRTGLLTAFSVNDSSLISAVVADLLKTERNGILTKSQTTVELARAKAENEASKDLAGTLVKLVEAFVAGRKRSDSDDISR
ncbi:hypothetical protein [Trinickia sp.]|uniref:hypothetical protein n=1 Tax=Trinickia sp. TaxID=2571163 RepID=UPI003F7F187E